MPFRDSLRGCIEQIAARFAHTGDDMLAITRCERGKYYTAMDMIELDAVLRSEAGDAHRIVFMGSARELLAFTDTHQMELPLATNTDNDDEPEKPLIDPTKAQQPS